MRIPSIRISKHDPITPRLERALEKRRTAAQPSQESSTPVDSKTQPKKINLGLLKVEVERPFSRIDHLLMANNLRGVQAFFKRNGAKSAAIVLDQPRVDTVGIPTGFSVKRDEETGRILPETDGPIGAVVAGEALRKAGKTVVYIVDTPNKPLLEAALKVIHPDFATDDKIKIEVFDHKLERGADASKREALRQAANNVLDKHGIKGLLAVELPARTDEGKYANMRGVSINDINSARDELLLAAHDRNRGKRAAERIITAGVGDGGNEAGMGGRKGIKTAIDGSVMASSVPADYPVTSWNSNLGGCAIGAVVAKRNNQLDQFTKPAQIEQMIDAVLAAGGVDGVTRSSVAGEVVDTPTGAFVTGVDGKPTAVHSEDLERLAQAVDDEIKPKKKSLHALMQEYQEHRRS